MRYTCHEVTAFRFVIREVRAKKYIRLFARESGCAKYCGDFRSLFLPVALITNGFPTHLRECPRCLRGARLVATAAVANFEEPCRFWSDGRCDDVIYV